MSKQGDARKLCQNVVRTKLDEYRFGKATNPNWAANPASATATAPENMAEAAFSASGFSDDARSQLADLSVASRTSTSVSTAGAGALATNGFMYAKVRYNRYFPTACNGLSTAVRLTANAQHPVAPPPASLILGIRECVGTSHAWIDEPPPAHESLSPRCNNLLDRHVADEIPGFKLYVKLERMTPLQFVNIPASTTPATTQFHATCPNFGGWRASPPFITTAASSMYDFNADGDGIRVTVTGVMDTEASDLSNPDLATFAGLPSSRTDAFVCAAQTTLYPEAFPVRYYLSGEGRIYPVQGGGVNGSTADTSWILRNLYTQTSTYRVSSIASFAVHPLNAAVYVLRGNLLTRFGNCGGSVLNCSTDMAASNGVSDSLTPGWPDVQEFEINTSIRSIAVDFLTSRIYGLRNDNNSVVEILIPCIGSNTCGKSGTPPPVIAYQEILPGVFPVPPTTVAGQTGIGGTGRISGFFISPGGESAFVSDHSSSLSRLATSYSSSIYNIADSELLWPIARLPVAAVSFSK
jgi:hypothetical protein